MAQTTAGALKALIESLGLGLTAYGDRAPLRTPRPYVEILEGIALTPDALEDGGPSTAVETVQVSLWQNWKSKTTVAKTESTTLAAALRRGIHGQRLALIGTAITYMVRVVASARILDPGSNIVHHAITLEINREL